MTRSQLRAEERRWRRGDLLTVAVAILLGTALAWIVLSMQGLRHDLRAANAARDALAQQVEHLGGTPVAGPAGSRGQPGESVVGPSGPPGVEGPQGEPGPTGSPGPSGSPGKDGSDGRTGASATGQPGAPGATGAAGPAGPAGPQGDPGPAGSQGDQGPAGPAGADGRDGQTCPDGFSLQAPDWDPDALVCRRDSTPQPSKKKGDSLLGMGLDPARRQYP
ncbi:collagen-like protein [Streptomyces sp. MMS24-I2-30]|uniref:collagen-like protein n=1 Tax=Streptomyces sp. MMS24-I2-30 TaxID=3351564 RepID=UPI003896895E